VVPWGKSEVGVFTGYYFLQLPSTLFATVIDVTSITAVLASVAHVLQNNTLDAQLRGAYWRMDLGAQGALEAGDVLDLTFNQAVALTGSSLPTAVFGLGALVAALESVSHSMGLGGLPSGPNLFFIPPASTNHPPRPHRCLWW
jgi:hypothetical protein